MKREDKMLMLAVLAGMSGLSLITSLLAKRKKNHEKDEDYRTMIVWGHSDNDEERFLDLYTKFRREQRTYNPSVRDSDGTVYKVHLLDKDDDEIEEIYKNIIDQRSNASKRELYKAYTNAVKYQKTDTPEMLDDSGDVQTISIKSEEGQ